MGPALFGAQFAIFFGKLGPGRLGPETNWVRQIGPQQIIPVLNIFVLDIYCQHLGNIYQLNLSFDIGYILPTIPGSISFGGCQCTLRAQGWGNVSIALYYISLYLGWEI